MEVDVPSSAALKNLSEQEWKKGRKRRSEASFPHKRYRCQKQFQFSVMYTETFKTSRHEKEKAYMEQFRSDGATVSEYVGNGQGEADTEEKIDEDAEPGVDDHHEGEVTSDSSSDGSSDDAHPLLFFYDSEPRLLEYHCHPSVSRPSSA